MFTLVSKSTVYRCWLNLAGSAGRGQCRPQHHAGGGEGAEGQCQCPGPDAIS